MGPENYGAVRRGGGLYPAALQCGDFTLMTYAIDGLTSGGGYFDFVFKPISQQLRGRPCRNYMKMPFPAAFITVSPTPARTRETAAKKLVNGSVWCCSQRWGPSPLRQRPPTSVRRPRRRWRTPSRGAKDGFVETVRSNTSLIRRHLRSPRLRFFESTVGAAEPDQRERRLAGRGHQPGTGPENGTAAENH